MSDHQPLHDAFAEYERRADAVGAARTASSPPPGRTSRVPMLLIAASVVLVLAIAGGVVWFAAGTGTTRDSKQPALVGPVPSRTSTVPSRTAPPRTAPPRMSTPRSSAPVSSTAAPGPTSSSTRYPLLPAPRRSLPPRPQRTAPRVTGPVALPDVAGSSTTPPGGGTRVPKNAKQMQRAFSRVLGDTASFTVDQHYGNFLTGILTATSSGAKGGYDIQASNGSPGDRAFCEDPGKGSHCTTSVPDEGGSLAVERETSDSGRGVLYFVAYVFPDGSTYLIHASNLADPKGAGHRYGPKPPLTLKQLTAVVESPLWTTD